MVRQQDSTRRASCSGNGAGAGAGPGPASNANADEETKERRRNQNRIAQRNHRRRKAAERAHTVSSEVSDQVNKRCGHCGSEPSSERPRASQDVCPALNKDLRASMPGEGQSVDVLPTPTDSLQNPVFSIEDMEFEGRAMHEPLFAEDRVSTIDNIDTSGLDGLDDVFLDLEAGGNSVTEVEAGLGHEAPRSDVSSSDGGTSPKRRRGFQNQTPSCRGQLALHLAAQGGFNSIINVLLNNGARLNLTDEQGRTALHYAVEGGHVETLKLLLSWGADSLILDSDGLSGLHLAAGRGDERMVSVLIANGADPNLRAQHVR